MPASTPPKAGFTGTTSLYGCSVKARRVPSWHYCAWYCLLGRLDTRTMPPCESFRIIPTVPHTTVPGCRHHGHLPWPSRSGYTPGDNRAQTSPICSVTMSVCNATVHIHWPPLAVSPSSHPYTYLHIHLSSRRTVKHRFLTLPHLLFPWLLEQSSHLTFTCTLSSWPPCTVSLPSPTCASVTSYCAPSFSRYLMENLYTFYHRPLFLDVARILCDCHRFRHASPTTF